MLSVAIEGRSYKTNIILEKYAKMFPKLICNSRMHENMLISFLAGITLENDVMMSTIVSLLPDEITNPTLHFNLACVYNLRNERDKVLHHAQKARELGKLSENFFREADFDSIRHDPQFQELVQ